MVEYLVIGIICLTVCAWLKFGPNPQNREKLAYFNIIAIGLAVRIIATNIDYAFTTDMSTFKAWAEMLHNDGFANFYISDAFTDYPPAYMYVLYTIGAIRRMFSLDVNSPTYDLVLKMPAIFADIASSLLLYSFARKTFSQKTSYIISFLYLFNPAAILISAVWGQMDSIFVFIILLSLDRLRKRDYDWSVVLYALSCLIKHQSAMFAPIYIFAFFNLMKEYNWSKEGFLMLFKSFLTGVLTALIIVLPFAPGLNFAPVFSQYFDSLSNYGYATFNAYNFYALLGKNHVVDTQTWIGITFSTWGRIAIIATTLLSLYALTKDKSRYNLFYVTGFINFTVFMFAARMHERYMFFSMIAYLVSYMYYRDKRILIIYAGITFTVFANCLDILKVFRDTSNIDYTIIEYSMPAVSMINLAVYIYMVYLYIVIYKERKLNRLTQIDEDYEEFKKQLETQEETETVTTKVNETEKFNTPLIEKPLKRKKYFMKKRDFIAVGIITFIYAIIAYINLGNTESPENFELLNANDTVIIEFQEEVEVLKVQYMLGARHRKDIEISYSTDNVVYSEPINVNMVSVFAWGENALEFTGKYIKIEAMADETYINELAFRDNNNDIIDISNSNVISSLGVNLFDEVALVPEYQHYSNSAIFDEIYHPRTAYEFIHGMKAYETTHPPLGKTIISWGIQIFGLNPFGWRFMGTLCGVLMVPLIYMFSKRMFKNTIWAIFTTIIFTFDFMHFAQTRLATIDSYLVLFVMMMYYFMYQYYQMNFYKVDLKKSFVPLLLSGISMGLAIATKWQGVYAAAGLAVLFFYTVFLRYQEFNYAKEIGDYRYTDVFVEKLVKTCGACVIFFVIIPLLIYIWSYVPFLNTQGQDEGLISIWNNQKSMFSYHVHLESEHPFASPWWSWPLNIRPIYYSSTTIGDGTFLGEPSTIRSAISAFGNPLVWGMGIFGFIYTLREVAKKNQKALFLLIALLAQMLPWVLVERTTYIYHYFPSIPFICLMATYLFVEYINKLNRKYKYIYLTAVVVVFAMFYPVLSGMSVPIGYVDMFLRWLPTWTLM